MKYTNALKFSAKSMGKMRGFALKNVREGFGIPYGTFATVKDDIKWQRQEKTLHKLDTLPIGATVPIYCQPKLHSTSRYGFVFVFTANGKIYADGKRIKDTKDYIERMKLSFKLYWGEYCDGRRVVYKEEA